MTPEIDLWPPCTCLCLYMLLHTSAYAYTYTYTHIHTYTRTLMLLDPCSHKDSDCGTQLPEEEATRDRSPGPGERTAQGVLNELGFKDYGRVMPDKQREACGFSRNSFHM